MKKSILAIDESKAIRFLLQTVLGRKYRVITASDGCSALYWLSKKNLPDIIIMDPQLPDMADWELVEHIRSSSLYGNIPVIVMTAMGRREAAPKCRRLGVKELFGMPFNPVELANTIDDIFEQEQAGLAPGGSRRLSGGLRVVKE